MIYNEISQKRYVGSARQFRVRKNIHWCLLRKGKHHSAHLQASWNKYGENAFSFYPLETIPTVTDEQLREREDHYIRLLRPEYNMSPVASRSVRSPDGLVRAAEASSKRYRVTAPNGEVSDIKNLKGFCRDRNLEYRYLWAVSKGRQGQAEGGWKAECLEHSTPQYTYRKRKLRVLHKDGKAYEFDDTKMFAETHGMHEHDIDNLLYGNCRISHGFTLSPNNP